MECCISCGSTFTLNVSVLCQLATRELEVSKKFLVIIPTLLVEFYPGSCTDCSVTTKWTSPNA